MRASERPNEWGEAALSRHPAAPAQEVSGECAHQRVRLDQLRISHDKPDDIRAGVVEPRTVEERIRVILPGAVSQGKLR